MNNAVLGFFTPWVIYPGVLVLHLLLPARRVVGYVSDEKSGEKLRYRLNGPLVAAVSVGIWLAADRDDRIDHSIGCGLEPEFLVNRSFRDGDLRRMDPPEGFEEMGYRPVVDVDRPCGLAVTSCDIEL